MNGAFIYESAIRVDWAFKKPPEHKERERIKDRRK